MHHDLDIHPIPEKVLYINELGIADTAFYYNTEEQHQKAHLPEEHVLMVVSASKEGVVLFPPPIDILGKTNIF